MRLDFVVKDQKFRPPQPFRVRLEDKGDNIELNLGRGVVSLSAPDADKLAFALMALGRHKGLTLTVVGDGIRRQLARPITEAS